VEAAWPAPWPRPAGHHFLRAHRGHGLVARLVYRAPSSLPWARQGNRGGLAPSLCPHLPAVRWPSWARGWGPGAWPRPRQRDGWRGWAWLAGTVMRTPSSSWRHPAGRCSPPECPPAHRLANAASTPCPPSRDLSRPGPPGPPVPRPEPERRFQVVASSPPTGPVARARRPLYRPEPAFARLPDSQPCRAVELGRTWPQGRLPGAVCPAPGAVTPAARHAETSSVGPRIAVLTVLTDQSATGERRPDHCAFYQGIQAGGRRRGAGDGQTATTSIPSLYHRAHAGRPASCCRQLRGPVLLLGSVVLPLKAVLNRLLSESPPHCGLWSGSSRTAT